VTGIRPFDSRKSEENKAMLKTCFILGAGLGTRMRPLTKKLPKPLLPIGGHPLISYVMDHCLTAGIKRFIVNTHHLAASYEAAFPDHAWKGTPIIFRHERDLLDTGGGLKNIEDLLDKDEQLLVYNGDILSDISLARLLKAHRAGKKEVTLALRSSGPVQNVSLDKKGVICDIRGVLRKPGVRSVAFTGIYIVEKRFLKRLKPKKAESVVSAFLGMIRKTPGSVASVVIDEGSWDDIGNPEAYRRVLSSFPEPARPKRPAPKPRAKKPADNEKSRGGPDRQGVPSPDAPKKPVVDAGLTEDSFVRGTLGLSAGESVGISPVGRGGSDRDYFRVALPSKGRAVILMRYGDMYRENDYYASIAGFLKEQEISVPAVYAHDPQKRLILMEDLGDGDLFALRERPWRERRALYEQTLRFAAKMHALTPRQIPAGLRLMEAYDDKLYRWERNYFLENLVWNVCGITLDNTEGDALEKELAAMAGRLLKTDASLIHRDLQSQNVMIKDKKPVLIDFQGMRFGSLFYDLGSLLYDPYVNFPGEKREELLRFYYDISGTKHAWKTFRGLFVQASAQRLIQALGAYGFLGLRRGKPHFLTHIPRGLENLSEAAGKAGNLPLLKSLAGRCREALAKKVP
jgi:NDP-sugar pyrophosphorylase family protein